MIYRWLLSLILLLSAIPIAALAQTRATASDSDGKRVALIIGNSAYKTQPLANPVNDARAMARALNDAGFQVRVRTNLSRSQMRDEIRKFGDELREQRGIGLFYYAGHGVQVNGRNYLIPVGSDIRRENEVEDEALDANFVLSTMESAKASMNIVILDACRDNPFAGSFRSTMRGLAPMSTPGSSIVAYATAPGQTAADGTGENGLYTKHLVEQISVPGQSILELFIKVRNGVQRDSGGRQTPWELSSLTVTFHFKPGVATAAPAPAAGANQADIDKAVQAALRKREAEEAERRATQQAEIERAVLAALKKREDEQTAQKGQAASGTKAAEAAIANLKKELAELRAARDTAIAPAPAAQTAATASQASAPPAQVALAAPSSRGKPAFTVGTRVERPEVRVGDRWDYVVTDLYTNMKSTIAMEVTTVTANRIFTHTFGSASVSGTAATVIDVWDHDWSLLRQGNIEFTPVYPFAKFPLESGNKWGGRVSIVGAGPTPVFHNMEVLVAGWERVTVPAGTFDAIRINVRGNFMLTGANSSGGLNDAYWYAPAARQFVKKEIQQLASYSGGMRRELEGHQRYERWELTGYKTD